MSTKINVLITGGNRGIGLEFVKQLVLNSNVKRVFATSRDPNYVEIVELQKQHDKGKIEIIGLDISNESSVTNAAKQIESVLLKDNEGLDIVINNAGSLDDDLTVFELSGDQLSKSFNNNVVGTHLITKALLPLMKRSETRKLVGISSFLGSLTRNDPKSVDTTEAAAYSISKAAMNMLFRQYSVELKNYNFIVVTISPGAVKTRMNPDATLTTQESVELQLKVILSLKINDNGSFFKNNGEILPW